MSTRDVLMGAALGASLAFLADPQLGRRRRALARDQVAHARRTGRNAVSTKARNLANRALGAAAATRARIVERHVDDEVLAERVRAKLGRFCSHPRAVDVDADQGHVTLRGQILASDLDRVLSGVSSVRGVTAVSNEMEVHEWAGGVPALQGEGRIAESELDAVQPTWSSGTQALVAAAGVAATGLLVAARARR